MVTSPGAMWSLHPKTISFKKTIRTLFSFNLENLIKQFFFFKKLIIFHFVSFYFQQIIFVKSPLFSILGLDYAFLHQIFKTGLIGFQKLMGHFGKAYANIFFEIEISPDSNIMHHPIQYKLVLASG